MATNAVVSQEGLLGGISLKAAGLIGTTTEGTATYLGGGTFRAVAAVTAVEAASNDELYVSVLEANTTAATGTWHEIGTVFAFGAAERTGRTGDDGAATVDVSMYNPYDNQVRVKTYVTGTIATGINYSLNAYKSIRS